MNTRYAKWLFTEDRMKELETHSIHMAFLQEWLRDYMRKSNDDSSKDALFWNGLFNYEWGDFVKQIVYRISYGDKRWDKHLATEAFGEALFALLCVGTKVGIDLVEAVNMTADKFNEQEWKRKR